MLNHKRKKLNQFVSVNLKLMTGESFYYRENYDYGDFRL